MNKKRKSYEKKLMHGYLQKEKVLKAEVIPWSKLDNPSNSTAKFCQTLKQRIFYVYNHH